MLVGGICKSHFLRWSKVTDVNCILPNAAFSVVTSQL